jgi:hypothetical protein
MFIYSIPTINYGRTSLPRSSSVSNTDEIHPRYDVMIKYFVENIIGYIAPLEKIMLQELLLIQLPLDGLS